MQLPAGLCNCARRRAAAVDGPTGRPAVVHPQINLFFAAG
jgi:hypothetical protein